MTAGIGGSGAAPRGLVIAAFAAIYLIWGSTCLAIRFAIETLPPRIVWAAGVIVVGVVIITTRRGPPPTMDTEAKNPTPKGPAVLPKGTKTS